MKYKHSPLASAVTLALLSISAPALADTATDDSNKTDTITVTGIRASKQKSLVFKKQADSVVEVVSAEDVGKMPDKNVADALQRLPGVTISSAAGGEGGFDENDRVSLRGTNPSLTQTLINGHAVGSGDWFILDQIVAVGRSVSYSLLPSELVSRVVVHKSSQADMPEGGIAGDVDIQTFRPLEFNKPLTLQGSLGAVHSTTAGGTDPQFSGLVNWKNDAGTVGVLGQAFSETRHLRRDGNEVYTLGSATIQASDPIAQGHPDLVGVSYPSLIGSTLFEQKRKREGGLIDVEFKPAAGLTLDLNGFYSHMDASNYNRNFMAFPQSLTGNTPYALNLPGNASYTSPAVPINPGYVVVNNTLVSASFPAMGTAAAPVVYGLVDQIYRPTSSAETSYFDLSGKYKVNDHFNLSGQAGYTKGIGDTPQDIDYEGAIVNSGMSYTLHGMDSTASVSFPGTNTADFTKNTLFGSTWGSYPAKTTDEESYGQLDGEYQLDNGLFTSLKAGLRYNDHKRTTLQVGASAGPIQATTGNLPAWGGQTYPGNFGSGLPTSGGFLTNVWQIPGPSLQAWAATNQTHDPVFNALWASDFTIEEKDTAGYLMGNFSSGNWGGNIGVRLVRTEERVLSNVAVPVNGTDCQVITTPGQPFPCSVPGAITTSSAGDYYPNTITHTYNDVLPSFNIKYAFSRDLIMRAAAARTMTRADYTALGGSVNLDDTNHTGSGGNPNLKPIRSNNLDLTLEWYYQPKALLSAGVFSMDLDNYVTYSVSSQVFRNLTTKTFDTYQISSPSNGKAKVDGLELAWEHPLGGGFGISANYTYADSRETDSTCGNGSPTGCDVVGASKRTYNLSGYYENDRFNAHIAYTYRSHYLTGLYNASPSYQDDEANVAAAVGYSFDKHFSVTFDALNLNNPVEKSYAANRDQPSSFYTNGRQFYLNFIYKN
ncbi:MAG: TonB-dependent receptor [Burkholderiales bacterium]|nr:TonB-dependent receptor [Burkholderiales bacterium]